jgi:hypothetical protein
MTTPFRATLRVTGHGRLADFGERVRRLMVRDIDSQKYSEHHAEGKLEYRFEIEKGIPFPAFASASIEFPELRVDADWEDAAQGVRGRAVIENGKLVEQSTEPIDTAAIEVDVAVAANGRLVLALGCRNADEALLGYAASAERHAYFRFAHGILLVAPEAGDRWEDGSPVAADVLAELEDIAFALAAQWLWYDEEPADTTALERARYADYGYAVRGANVKSERIGRLRSEADAGAAMWRDSTLGESGRRARDALLRAWAKGEVQR